MTRIGTRWQIRGTTRWMTRDEMLGMNPNVMVIPEVIRVDYGTWKDKRVAPRYQCECVTTSTRKQCTRRAKFRYINVYGRAKDMCGTHFSAWGLGSMEDQHRFDDWYDRVGFTRSDQAEVDARIAEYNAAERTFYNRSDTP